MASREGANVLVRRVVVVRVTVLPRVGLTTRADTRVLGAGVVTRGPLAEERGATTVLRGAEARMKPLRGPPLVLALFRRSHGAAPAPLLVPPPDCGMAGSTGVGLGAGAGGGGAGIAGSTEPPPEPPPELPEDPPDVPPGLPEEPPPELLPEEAPGFSEPV